MSSSKVSSYRVNSAHANMHKAQNSHGSRRIQINVVQ